MNAVLLDTKTRKRLNDNKKRNYSPIYLNEIDSNFSIKYFQTKFKNTLKYYSLWYNK